MMDEAEYHHALDAYQKADTTELPPELTSFMSKEDTATLASCINTASFPFSLRGTAGKSMLMINKYINDPVTDYHIKALDVLVEEKTAKKQTREEMEKPMADEAYRLSRAKVVLPPPDKKNKLTLDESNKLWGKVPNDIADTELQLERQKKRQLYEEQKRLYKEKLRQYHD